MCVLVASTSWNAHAASKRCSHVRRSTSSTAWRTIYPSSPPSSNEEGIRIVCICFALFFAVFFGYIIVLSYQKYHKQWKLKYLLYLDNPGRSSQVPTAATATSALWTGSVCPSTPAATVCSTTSCSVWPTSVCSSSI